MILEEGRFGYHHAIAKTAKVCSILDFLCEDVTGVNLTWDMGDVAGTGFVMFADHVLAKVEMFYTLGGAGCRPLNTSGVIVVDGGSGSSIEHPQVDSSKLDGVNILDAFIGGNDFSFT